MQWQAIDRSLHEWVNNYGLQPKETGTPKGVGSIYKIMKFFYAIRTLDISPVVRVGLLF
jgi:hypothetical protein